MTTWNYPAARQIFQLTEQPLCTLDNFEHQLRLPISIVNESFEHIRIPSVMQVEMEQQQAKRDLGNYNIILVNFFMKNDNIRILYSRSACNFTLFLLRS